MTKCKRRNGSLPCAGCIDLQRQEITHAYCPPPRFSHDGSLRPAMWQPGSPFVSLQLNYHAQGEGATAYSSLEFLDLNSGSASPCMIRGVSSPLPFSQPEASRNHQAFAEKRHPTWDAMQMDSEG